jgi:hypothetical protein
VNGAAIFDRARSTSKNLANWAFEAGRVLTFVYNQIENETTLDDNLQAVWSFDERRGRLGMKSNLKLSFATVLAVGAMLSLVGTARANLVANPGFDLDSPGSQTAPLDWSLTPATAGADFFVGPGPVYGAFSSPNSANFGATSTFDDELSQVLATTAGQAYSISFELAHTDTDTANDFSVQFGGTTIFSLLNAPAFGYTLETFTATATSSSTTLAFFGRENPSWYDLDNVSVGAVSATPLPATWTMLIAGFIGLGLCAYRGTKSATAIAAA